MPRHLPRKWNFRKVFVSAARSYGSTVVRRFPAFSSSTLVNSPTLLLRIILNLLAEGRYYLLNRRKSISFFFLHSFKRRYISLSLFISFGSRLIRWFPASIFFLQLEKEETEEVHEVKEKEKRRTKRNLIRHKMQNGSTSSCDNRKQRHRESFRVARSSRFDALACRMRARTCSTVVDKSNYRQTVIILHGIGYVQCGWSVKGIVTLIRQLALSVPHPNLCYFDDSLRSLSRPWSDKRGSTSVVLVVRDRYRPPNKRSLCNLLDRLHRTCK